MKPRCLLLQIRHDPAVRAEEYQCFLRYTGLPPERLDVFNIYSETDFGNEVLNGYDALLVGGASEANVLQPDRYRFVRPAIGLLRHCADVALPVFASCFGFQLAILALGGEITAARRCHETGTLPLDLTPEAATDPLFATMPDPLMAVSVHQQSAETLPDHCQLLAATDKCVHAFRVLDKPFWAFQFHPEVDRDTLICRLSRYQKKYTADEAALREVLESAVETPEANRLPALFIEYLQGRRQAAAG